jgi:hypothetical protein
MNLSYFRKAKSVTATAFVAAFLLFSLQVVELQHQHTFDDSQVDCLLCKTSADHAPSLSRLMVAVSIPHVPVTTPVAMASISTHYLQLPIRGPPAQT